MAAGDLFLVKLATALKLSANRTADTAVSPAAGVLPPRWVGRRVSPVRGPSLPRRPDCAAASTLATRQSNSPQRMLMHV